MSPVLMLQAVSRRFRGLVAVDQVSFAGEPPNRSKGGGSLGGITVSPPSIGKKVVTGRRNISRLASIQGEQVPGRGSWHPRSGRGSRTPYFRDPLLSASHSRASPFLYSRFE